MQYRSCFIFMIAYCLFRRKMATSGLLTNGFPLIDIGANLVHKSFKGNIAKVLERASQAQVSSIIITGTNLAGSREAVRIANQFNQEQASVKLYTTVGIHPHDATRHLNFNYRDQMIELIEMNRKRKYNPIVAMGECGLDFDRNFSLPDDQRRVFDTQLQLACEFDLPLFMHERSAPNDMLTILNKYAQHEHFRGVIHCFTNGSLDILRQYLSLNLYIGITGWVCDERRGQSLAKIVPHIPLDRLLIETDAPFLLPRNMARPWATYNEPSYLPYVVKKLAECYGTTIDEITQRTTENAQTLFGIDKK
jgi:TatD DNase family protein